MNKLKITKNGVVVEIEQTTPIDAVAITKAIEAIGDTPKQIEYVPYPVYPNGWWQQPYHPYWLAGQPVSGTSTTQLKTIPVTTNSICLSLDKIEELRRSGQLSFTSQN